jgi:hypothetical protein
MPLQPRAKQPLGKLVPQGFQDATADLAQVLRWWTARPDANVGIACGLSGMVVLDIDPRHGGDDAMADLESELGELPQTVESHSGGGGVHLLFRHPGGALVGEAAPGVDVKDRGYIVAPPSIHPSGGEYVWSVDGHPEDVGLANLPQGWLDRLQRQVRTVAPASIGNSADPLRRIPAATYVSKLTGREVVSRPNHHAGWVRCPFHGDGTERTPSLKVEDTIWTCFACPPIGGKLVRGGNIYDFAAGLRDLPMPLRGADFSEVQAELSRLLLADERR